MTILATNYLDDDAVIDAAATGNHDHNVLASVQLGVSHRSVPRKVSGSVTNERRLYPKAHNND